MVARPGDTAGDPRCHPRGHLPPDQMPHGVTCGPSTPHRQTGTV
jgi:hypothetical protein